MFDWVLNMSLNTTVTVLMYHIKIKQQMKFKDDIFLLFLPEIVYQAFIKLFLKKQLSFSPKRLVPKTFVALNMTIYVMSMTLNLIFFFCFLYIF